VTPPSGLRPNSLNCSRVACKRRESTWSSREPVPWARERGAANEARQRKPNAGRWMTHHAKPGLVRCDALFSGAFNAAAQVAGMGFAASRPLEYPQIVLVSATTAELLRRSKTAPAVLQFITKGDRQLKPWTLDSPRGHQHVTVPAQAGHDSLASVVRCGDFTTIRQKLEFRFDRLAVKHDGEMTLELRLAVLDPQNTTLHGGSDDRAQHGGLPVQLPLARERSGFCCAITVIAPSRSRNQ
jgi:hypothetical protein